MTAVVVLIHFHIHPTVTLVHVDTIIQTGLVPHLDHPVILIGGRSPEIDYCQGRD